MTKEDKVRRILDLSGSNEMITSMFGMFGMDSMVSQEDKDAIIDVSVSSYLKRLADADVDAILAFYETESARNWVKIQADPEVAQEAISAGEAIAARMIARITGSDGLSISRDFLSGFTAPDPGEDH